MVSDLVKSVAGLLVMAAMCVPANGQAVLSSPRPSGGAQPEQPFVQLSIPELPSRGDVQHWADVMKLSPAQRQVFTAYYESFLAHEGGRPREQLTELWDWSAALGPVHSKAYSDAEIAHDLGNLNEAATEWVKRLIRSERELIFDPMRPFLAEEQLPLLRRVRYERECAIYRLVDVFHFSAKVDLVALVDELLSEELIVVQANGSDVESVLNDYAGTMMRLWRGYYIARRDVVEETPLLRAQGHEGASSRLRRFLRRSASKAESICQFNDTYATLIADELDAVSSEVFLAAYRARAHPQVYPNPYKLDSVFHVARDLPNLSAEQRAEINWLEEGVDEQMNVICNRMIAAIHDWIDQFLRQWSFNHEDRQTQIETLTTAHSERKLVAETAVHSLMEIVGEENAGPVAEAAHEVWATAARLKPMEDGLYYFVAYRTRR